MLYIAVKIPTSNNAINTFPLLCHSLKIEKNMAIINRINIVIGTKITLIHSYTSTKKPHHQHHAIQVLNYIIVCSVQSLKLTTTSHLSLVCEAFSESPDVIIINTQVHYLSIDYNNKFICKSFRCRCRVSKHQMMVGWIA